MSQKKNLIEVEGNIIETLPIHCEHNIKRNSEGLREIVKRPGGVIEIDHHSRYWTEFDLDVIVAAFALSKIRGELKKFNATKKDIAEVLGLKYDRNNRRNIGESMKEISAAIHYKGSFYDVNGKKYTATGSTQLISHHFVNLDEMKKEKTSGRDIRNKSWISIGEVFWESLKAGYYKIIDLETYKQLPRGWVRKTYLFIEKRLGRDGSYTVNAENFIRSVTGKETLTASDVKNFKRRVLKKLSRFYNYKFAGDAVTIARPEKLSVDIRQPRLFPRLKQKPLSDWDKEILEKVSKFCGRSDDYFKNTITKYIRRLGPERVYAAMKDTECAAADDKDKYLIHLLKTTE